MAVHIQRTRTLSGILIQQQMNGRSRSLLRCTDERTEENVRQRVEPHVHCYDIGGNHSRISSIHHNAPFPDAGSQINRKQGQSQFRIAINRNTPEAPSPAAKEEVRKSRCPIA